MKSDWWVVQRPGSPPLFWEHAAELDCSPIAAARDILSVFILHRSIALAQPKTVPKLMLAGQSRRRGIPYFMEAQL